MIEDAMLHRGPRMPDRALGNFVKRIRELRKRLEKAQTQEEIDAIAAELEKAAMTFDREKAVMIHDD